MSIHFKDAAPVVANYLEFLRVEYDSIFKIVSLVQENREFFGNPKLGGSSLKAAADKLERDIKAYKDEGQDRSFAG